MWKVPSNDLLRPQSSRKMDKSEFHRTMQCVVLRHDRYPISNGLADEEGAGLPPGKVPRRNWAPDSVASVPGTSSLRKRCFVFYSVAEPGGVSGNDMMSCH